MSELSDQVYKKVSGEIDPFKKILTYIPGFQGYIERQSRRDADKIIRDTIANRFEAMGTGFCLTARLDQPGADHLCG